jgi:hypothetical protein
MVNNLFLNKVEKAIGHLDKMIRVADGARWIWNWLDDVYPDHHQVLDFYYASEKLHGFAREAFKDPQERTKWVDHQSGLLLDDGIEVVIVSIESVRCRGSAREKQASLPTYYENIIKRMQYKAYKANGWLIGCGPMGSAHRTVIRQRMKPAGQRWPLHGAQQIVNLRVAEKSGQWNKVKDLICNPINNAKLSYTL